MQILEVNQIPFLAKKKGVHGRYPGAVTTGYLYKYEKWWPAAIDVRFLKRSTTIAKYLTHPEAALRKIEQPKKVDSDHIIYKLKYSYDALKSLQYTPERFYVTTKTYSKIESDFKNEIIPDTLSYFTNRGIVAHLWGAWIIVPANIGISTNDLKIPIMPMIGVQDDEIEILVETKY